MNLTKKIKHVTGEIHDLKDKGKMCVPVTPVLSTHPRVPDGHVSEPKVVPKASDGMTSLCRRRGIFCLGEEGRKD